jgi:HSP20 family protein
MTETTMENTSTEAECSALQKHEEFPESSGPSFFPRVDLFETDSEIVLKCDMPGVKPEDVDLRFEKGILSLHGKVCCSRRSNGSQSESGQREYGIGDFRRTFSIPVKVDATKLSAESSLGVLTVHLPKHEEAKPQKVVVKAI